MFNIKTDNPNYLAKIFRLPELRPHPNADRLSLATVDNQTIITSKDAKVGELYVFFPLESKLNLQYLSFSNSFSSSDLNRDKTKKGYFGNAGRIKATKLRGTMSEGFIIPLSDLVEWLKSIGEKVNINDNLEGIEFSHFNNILIVEKYISPQSLRLAQQNNKGEKVKRENRIVDGQFKLSPDYRHLKREIHTVRPDDWIEISSKWHGAQCTIAKVLVKRNLKWYEKILNCLGVKIDDKIYDLVYSSRKVIKNQYGDNTTNKISQSPKERWDTLHLFQKKVIANELLTEEDYRKAFPLENKDAGIYTWEYTINLVEGLEDKFTSYCEKNPLGNHYYGTDVWGIVVKRYADCIQNSITLYGELVGFTPSGSPIQSMKGKPYDYGCKPGECDFIVFRITSTNDQGQVYEFSLQQVVEYCNKFGLKHVPVYYIGKAKDKYPDLFVTDHWHENFLNRLIEEYLEKDDIYCNSKGLPDEGIVLSKRIGGFEGLKLKSQKFVLGESEQLDKDEVNIEDAA